ncbi:MAG TPA: outer membrane beta-barrel protein, partial [Flavisolibacter sp.]|nr:outer membrane beta-barrel protein [Flavisolibacter sp.]
MHFAFFAGPQITSAKYLVNGIKQPANDKFGLMGGIAAKVVVENNFYFFPAMYYSLRGYKVTLNNPSYPPTELAKNNNTTIHTIQIAPLFQFDLSKKPSYLFIRFGPSINLAVSAK